MHITEIKIILLSVDVKLITLKICIISWDKVSFTFYLYTCAQ